MLSHLHVLLCRVLAAECYDIRRGDMRLGVQVLFVTCGHDRRPWCQYEHGYINSNYDRSTESISV